MKLFSRTNAPKPANLDRRAVELARFSPRSFSKPDSDEARRSDDFDVQDVQDVDYVELTSADQGQDREKIELKDRFGPKIEVTTIEEFSVLPLAFEELVNDLQLGSHLGFNIQPAIFGGPRSSGAARIALLVTSGYAMSDEVLEILSLLTDAKRWGGQFRLWEHAPRIVVSHGLMLALTRGEINKEGLGNRRSVSKDPKKHSFYLELERIVRWGIEQNASDIHYNLNFDSDYSQVRFTIHGRYVAPPEFRMATRTLFHTLSVAWMYGTGGNGPSYDTRIEQQCRVPLVIDEKPVMLRWASASTEAPGPSVTTRISRSDINIGTLEDLTYLPEQVSTFNRAMNAEKGAIILVGVVNSGKTVTIATLMKSIPDYRKKMGIEDPVEIVVPGMLHKSINRPLEGDTGREFDPIAKTIKRFAINDILIGEVRDRPTGMLLVDVVLMGTSAYTTTHAPSALGAFDKLASDMVGVSKDFLSVPGNIKLLTYQALIPSLCSCALPLLDLARNASSEYCASGRGYINRINKLYDLDEAKLRIRNPAGCEKCRHKSLPQLNGFAGRALAAEMVEPDEVLLSMVKKGDSLGMRRHVADLRGGTRFDDPSMVGKSAMECAIYKASMGILDPREIEPRFHSFEREEMIRASSLRYNEHVEKQVVAAIRSGSRSA